MGQNGRTNRCRAEVPKTIWHNVRSDAGEFARGPAFLKSLATSSTRIGSSGSRSDSSEKAPLEFLGLLWLSFWKLTWRYLSADSETKSFIKLYYVVRYLYFFRSSLEACYLLMSQCGACSAQWVLLHDCQLKSTTTLFAATPLVEISLLWPALSCSCFGELDAVQVPDWLGVLSSIALCFQEDLTCKMGICRLVTMYMYVHVGLEKQVGIQAGFLGWGRPCMHTYVCI